MKKTSVICLAIILACSLIIGTAHASAPDPWLIMLQNVTIDELFDIRDALNNELGQRLSKLTIESTNIEGRTLREIFPCLTLAKIVRDSSGMVSVDQVPTVEQLARVKDVSSYDVAEGEEINDLTGILYLANLRSISLYNDDKCNALASLPDEFYKLSNVEYIDISGTSIQKLSEELCDMTSLISLDCGYGDLASLPKNIGNLVNLKYLNISYTDVAVLPDSICNLSNLEILNCQSSKLLNLPENIGMLTSLEKLDISDTCITSLPSSIFNLSLETFEKKGLDLE